MGGLNIMDRDAQQQILSLASYGLIRPSRPVVVPETGQFLLAIPGTVGSVGAARLRKRSNLL